MVEVLIAGFFADLVLEVVYGAGGFDCINFPAAGADKVVAVFPWLEEGEIGGAFVQAEAADDGVIGEALEEAVDGGLVALIGEALGGGELGECHGSLLLDESGEEFFEGFGAAQAEISAACDGLFQDVHVV